MKAIQQWFIKQGYEFVQQIGQGSFGSIFSVLNEEGNVFCVKVEILDPLEKSYLIHEAYILKQLQQLVKEKRSSNIIYDKDKPHIGILQFFGYEIIENINTLTKDLSRSAAKQQSKTNKAKTSANMMFMEYGGISLNTFKQQKKIDEQTWFILMFKLLDVMQQIHRLGVIHRDLKPQNILIRRKQGKISKEPKSWSNPDEFGDNYNVFIIDFGLARLVRKPNQQVFIQKSQGGFAGTVNYASIRAHRGEYQHYADDLESILYIMLYMATGTLPWINIGIKQSIEDKYQTIMIAKQQLFERNPIIDGKKQHDTRFSQFNEHLTLNQQKFLRVYSNAIFKQNVGNLGSNPNYKILFDEIDKYCKIEKNNQDT